MTTIWRFAALGALSGAIAGTIVSVAGNNATLLALYCAPGIAFGIVIGAALVRFGQLHLVTMLLFLAAAGLSNAAAVFCGIDILEGISHEFESEVVALAFIGLGAGAVGAILLTLASKALLPLTSLARPIATGTICGALLPLMVEAEMPGTIAFYVIWQAAFASALARSLEPPFGGAAP